MRKLPLAVLASLIVVACTPETPKVAFKHTEKRGKLEKNGIRFVLMPDDSTPLVNVAVRWDVGGREDPPGKAGLAHVVEHLMFQPRPDGPNSPPLFQSIVNLAVGGDMNAYTSEDTTHYYETVRGENLDDAIKIEAMRQFYFFNTITDVEFQRERDVVRNEIRQRGGTAEGQIRALVLQAIYPKGHAYENEVGGNDAQLTTITLEDAKEFVRKYYAPERATVLVAGGFNPDDAAKSIDKWFGKLEARKPEARRKVDDFEIKPGTQELTLDVDRPIVGVAWKIPDQDTPEGEAVNFGINQAFFKTLVASSEYDFATRIIPTQLGGRKLPIFMIFAEVKSEDKIPEALDFIRKSTHGAGHGADFGMSTDVEEQNNIAKADFIQGMEALGARTNIVGDLVQFSTDIDFNSHDVYVFHELDKISKFDLSKVEGAVKRYIDMDKAKIVIIHASSKGIKGDTRNTSVAFNGQKDEAIVEPDVDPKEAYHPISVKGADLGGLTGVKKVTLGNGMDVVMMPVHAMPIITAELVFRNVGSSSTPDNPSLGRRAAEFLRLPMDAEAFRRTGVNAHCDVDPDDMVCESHGLKIYLDIILKSFDRLIKTSEYSQEGIEKWQKRVKDEFGTRSAQEQLEFRRQVLTAFYGADHPYTLTALETPENASKIHQDSLRSFRDKHYAAGNATLVLVGDFDPVEAEKNVRSVFGGWSRGSVKTPAPKATAPRTGPTYIGVVSKEEPQITLVMGYPAPAGIDGLQAGRAIVGDMLQYRVDDVRFKLGTTYGMGAGHTESKGPNSYRIQGKIDALRGGESLKAIRDYIEALRQGEKFEVDFVRARRKRMRDLMGGSTVTAEIADRLSFIASFALDPNYYGQLLQRYGSAAPAQVKALIKSELDPNKEIIVVKGSREQIDKTFADAGIKDVKIVEPEYKQ